MVLLSIATDYITLSPFLQGSKSQLYLLPINLKFYTFVIEYQHMQKSNRLLSILMCTIAVVSVCLNAYLIITHKDTPTTPATLSNAYKLYIVIPNEVTNTDDYIHRLEAILADRVPGFTMYPTRGGTRQNDGSVDYQTTLVCELYDTDENTAIQIGRDAISTFNIPTVPIASNLAGWQIIR